MPTIRLSHLQKSSPRLVNLLRAVWAVAILWFELGTFLHHVSQCTWPDIPINPDPQRSETTRDAHTHVLLVADPQVLDHRSYPGRAPWLMWLSQRMVDVNLRRSWWATLRLRPHSVVFLGDMMDGGRFAMDDAEYEGYYARFKSIFALHDDTPVHYIPGNHDVGIGGVAAGFSDQAHARYVAHFGALNARRVLANHTFVAVDAPGLVEEDAARAAAGLSFPRWAAARPAGPIAFVLDAAAAAQGQADGPVVLLTHIPLGRPDTASCGPLRERGSIRQGTGYGYENTLSTRVSQFLLESLRPVVVFSGDDHDYCEYRHPLPAIDDIPLSTTVKEISVKSFSMAMGVRRPGFQLLSLVPPASVQAGTPTFRDVPCVLPDQIGIYVSVYVPLIALSVLALLLANAHRAWQGGARAGQRTLRTRSPTDEEHLALWGAAPAPRPPRILLLADDADEGDGAHMLPPPTPAAAVSAKGRRSRSCMASATRARSVRRLLCCGRRGPDTSARRSRTGVLRGTTDDVLEVAWVPVGLFVAIAWWMFW